MVPRKQKRTAGKRNQQWAASLFLCASLGMGRNAGVVQGFSGMPAQPPSRVPTLATVSCISNPDGQGDPSWSDEDGVSSQIRASPLEASFSSRDLKQRNGEWYEQEEYQQKRHRKRQWLHQTTETIINKPPGTLMNGKWQELGSLLSAWSSFVKSDADAPLRMEAILKRVHDERRAGNEAAMADIEMYNRLLDAWACSALFKTRPNPEVASQRAREILVLLQETYERDGEVDLMPNEDSFHLVLHAVCKTEGPTIARRLLALMEYLHRSGKNANAKPSKADYISVLYAYTKRHFIRSKGKEKENTGALVEGFIRHMYIMGGIEPTALHYNLAIKAWTQSKGGREAAEHADRILEDMQAPKDIVTYASAISAWAASGMGVHAVQRAEELLRQIESEPHLEPNTIVLNAVMSAWVKSKSPGAPNRTGELLMEMERSCEPSIQPDLVTYNTHLHALSQQAKKPGMAQSADALLTRMEEMHERRAIDFAPNLFSYNLVIESWSKSPLPEAAMQAAHVLRKLARRPGVEPDVFSFHQVLSALARKGATKVAEDLLLYMEKAYISGVHPNAKPDAMAYAQVIQAYARSGEAGAAANAERLLRQMTVKPNRNVYNAVIQCWARSGEGTLGARKAEALLQEMQALSKEYNDESLAPNIVTFNSLLNAWALSGTRCCGHKAEFYLNQMWQLYNAGDNTLVKPNDTSYNTVINAISKSKNIMKAQRALGMLRKMDKLYQAGVNDDAKPNEVTYTAVLNSCAFPAALDERTRRKALATAIFTLEELKGSCYGHANQITYGTFFKAVRNLLHDDDDLRRAVVREVFKQCCEDGQVGDMVLTSLRAAAPADLFEELVVEVVRQSSSGKETRYVTVADLPPEWCSNVRARSVAWRPPRSAAPQRRNAQHRKRSRA